jgi:hypothetical protein
VDKTKELEQSLPDPVWKDEFSAQFAVATRSSKRSNSPNWRRFIGDHVEDMTDLTVRQTAALVLSVPEVVSDIPVIGSKVSTGIEIVKEIGLAIARPLIARFRGSRFDAIDRLPDIWDKFPLRPFGILAYGRSLHW